ncbi:MAG TPA: LysR family transcriptional regulator substrate-binding protein, partial [Methylomirabilota bacterium]|nr:LysR family transcriptional regulator substrate-binding protein [Methylomirabilota bacterium]
HMRQLEARCGTALLERVGKRAFATAAGALLLEHAGRAFAELEAAQEALRRLRGVVAGRLRLGTGATASIHLLPPLLRQMRARYPEIELIVVTGNAPDIAAAISDNELDVGIVTLPVTGRQLLITPLRRDPLVAVAPPGQWRGRGGLTAVELARHPLILYERGGTIRRVIDAWFRRGGARPRVVMELGNEEAIKKLVGAGLGVSVSPAIAVRDEVRAGALQARPLAPALVRRLGLVRRRDKTETPALRVFLAAVAALSENRAKGPSSGDGAGARSARRAPR